MPMRPKPGHAQRRRGVTLIVAILVLSVVAAIGVTMSTLVVFQVRLNRVSGDSHQGTYLAESGIEHGLYLLNTLKGGTLTAALLKLQSVTAQVPDVSGSSYYSPAPAGQLDASTATSSVASVPSELQVNQNAIIELYNVDASLTKQDNFDAVTLCIFGDGGGAEQLEVSWVAWNNLFTRTAPQRKVLAHDALISNTSCVDLNVPIFPTGPLSNVAGYRVKLQALPVIGGADGTVKNLSITVKNSIPTDVTVPTQIQLKSVSTLREQTQALVAIYPWALPLSALYDFVIFSERTLTKYVPIVATEDVRIYGPWDAVDGAVPDTTPFANCATTPCSYYVRLLNSAGGVVPNYTSVGFDNSSPASQSTSGTITSGASSCILSIPFVFNTNITPDATFNPNNSPNMQYQLLTHITSNDPNETTCP